MAQTDNTPQNADAQAPSKPVLNWDNAPEWATHAARDENGSFWWLKDPYLCNAVWVFSGDAVGVNAPDIIHPGTCDWRDSLVERPALGEKWTELVASGKYEYNSQVAPQVSPDTTNPDGKLLRDMTDAEVGALVRAKNEGKVIECFSLTNWHEVRAVSWDADCAYRTRPEPKRESLRRAKGYVRTATQANEGQ